MAGSMQHRVATMETRFTASGVASVRSAADQVSVAAERASARANAVAAGVQANLAKAAAASRVAAARMARELSRVDILKAKPGGADPFAVVQAEARAKEARNVYGKSRFALKQASDKAIAQSMAAGIATVNAAEKRLAQTNKQLWAEFEAGNMTMEQLSASMKKASAGVDAIADATVIEEARVRQVTAAILAKAAADDKAVVSSLRHGAAEKLAASEEGERADALAKAAARAGRRQASRARTSTNTAALKEAGQKASTAQVLLGTNVLGTPSRVMAFAKSQGVLGLALKGVGLGFGGIGLGLRLVAGVAGFAVSGLEKVGRLGMRAVGAVGDGIWSAAKGMTSFAANVAATAAMIPVHFGSSVVRGVWNTLARSIGRIDRLMLRVIRRAGALTAALHLIGGTAVFKLSTQSIDETAKRGQDVRDKAISHGLTTDQVQGIEGQAKRYGSDPEAILKQYNTFRETLAKAQQNPQGQEAAAFQRFGIRTADMGGHAADPRTVFAQFGREFGFADADRKQLMAQALLGDGSAAVRDRAYYNSLAGQGVNGLNDTSYARTLGTYLSPRDIAALQLYKRESQQVSDAWSGVKTSIAKAVLPTMMQLGQLAMAFLVTYRETIASFVSGKMAAIGRELAAVAIVIQAEAAYWRSATSAADDHGQKIPFLLKAYVIFDHYLRGPLTATFGLLWRGLKAVGSVIKNVADDLMALYSGPLDADLHYPWLTTLWDMGMHAVSVVQKLASDLHTLYDGPLDADLSYPWLSGLWDWGMKCVAVVKSVSRDLWNLTTKGSGQSYTVENLWLYKLWYWGGRAWEMVKSVARDLWTLATRNDGVIENLWVFQVWQAAKGLGGALLWVGQTVTNLFGLMTGASATNMPWLDALYHGAQRARDAVMALFRDMATVATGSNAPMQAADPFAGWLGYLQQHRREIIDYVEQTMAEIWAVLSGDDAMGQGQAKTVGGKVAEQVRDLVGILLACKDKVVEVWTELGVVLSGGPGARGQSTRDPWLTSLVTDIDNVSSAVRTLRLWFTELRDDAAGLADPLLKPFGLDLSTTLLFITFAKFTGMLRVAKKLLGAGWGTLAEGLLGGKAAGAAAGAASAAGKGAEGGLQVAAEAVENPGIARRALNLVEEGLSGVGALGAKAASKILPSSVLPYAGGIAKAAGMLSRPLALGSIVQDGIGIGQNLGRIWDLREGGAVDQADAQTTDSELSADRARQSVELPYYWLRQEQARAREYADRTVGMGDIAANRRTAEDFVRKDDGFNAKTATFNLYFTPSQVVTGTAAQDQLDALRRSGLWSLTPPTTAGGRS